MQFMVALHPRRNKGLVFFKVPLPNNEFNKKWGSELINNITKDREIDASLKTRIDSRKLISAHYFHLKNEISTNPV